MVITFYTSVFMKSILFSVALDIIIRLIPLIGEMSAKQTKGCPNSENFAPAAYAPSDEGAVKCNAFDWGRETSRYFLSPSVFCLRQKPPPYEREGMRGAESSPPTNGRAW